MKTEIKAVINPENIDMLTRIIEACSHLGVVSTLDRQQGLVIIRGTADTCPELEIILQHLPFELTIQKDSNGK